MHANASGLLQPGVRDTKQSDPRNYIPSPTAPKLSTNLEKQLASRGVDVILGDRVAVGPSGAPLAMGPLPGVQSIPLVSGKTVEADYIFLSTGNVPNSALVAAADKAALTPSGHIAVDSLFRVIPGAQGTAMSGEYYALGDVASVPAWKTLVSAGNESPALAKIIDAEVKGKTPAAYTPPRMGESLVVTLGTAGGAGTLAFPYVGQWNAPGMVMGMKSKDFFAGKAFYSRFQGRDKVTV